MSVPYALLDLLDAANAARRAGATEAEIAHAAGIELPRKTDLHPDDPGPVVRAWVGMYRAEAGVTDEP